MALPVERWVRQAFRSKDPLSVYPSGRALADLDSLVQYERQFWARRNAELIRSGELTALQGGFAGLPNVPPAAALANVTSINGTVALWTSSLHSPINANAVQAPQAYRLAASGLWTTVTSPGNVGFDVRAGAGSTINTAISGTTMGASPTFAATASLTMAWRVEGDMTVRAIGGPGANSTVQFFGTCYATNAALPATWANVLAIGGTQASVDLSVAGGLSFGFVSTVTTITPIVTHQVHFSSWN